MAKLAYPTAQGTFIASVTAFVLAVLKVTVGLSTGSLSVLTSALDSIFDTVVSGMKFFALRWCHKRPSEDFGYGLGKLEALIGEAQSLIIIAIGGFLVWEGWQKVNTPGEIMYFDWGIAAMMVSMVGTLFLTQYLKRIQDKHNSILLRSEIHHYESDVVANAAVLIGMVIMFFTGDQRIDGLLTMFLAAVIVFSGFEILWDSICMLLDREIRTSKRQRIEMILDEAVKEKWIRGYHFLRTRRSGDFGFVTVHLVFTPKTTLDTAHKIGEQIEQDIYPIIEKGEVLLHFDPYDDALEEKQKFWV